jgi:hypothetical protein
MIRFSAGLLGLIAVAGAYDNISLTVLIPFAVLCIAVMLTALPTIAE